MKNDALNKFKEEMNQRGLFRKIQVAANLIPPPPGADGEHLIELRRSNTKVAIFYYADQHKDFGDLLMDAAVDHLLDSVLTDDLFTPDHNFIPTKEEVDTMHQAEEATKVVKAMFGGLADLLKTI